MDKENIELAKEHLELAEQIVDEESADADKKTEKEFVEAKFALERANSEVSDLEEVN